MTTTVRNISKYIYTYSNIKETLIFHKSIPLSVLLSFLASLIEYSMYYVSVQLFILSLYIDMHIQERFFKF